MLNSEIEGGYTLEFSSTARIQASYNHTKVNLLYPFTFIGDENERIAEWSELILEQFGESPEYEDDPERLPKKWLTDFVKYAREQREFVLGLVPNLE